MTVVHDKMTRSYNMSQIRSKNTKPEILVRKYLFSKGFRFRILDKNFLENLISDIEARLKQKTVINELFTIRWAIK